MALDMKESGEVGCAYYEAMDGALCLQEDIAMAGMEVTETLLLHAQPTIVITTNRIPDKAAEYLESCAQAADDNQGTSQVPGSQSPPTYPGPGGNILGAYALRIVASSEFNYAAGRDRLLNLEPGLLGPHSAVFASVAEEDMDAGVDGSSQSTQSKLMRLGTHINLESYMSVGFYSMCYVDRVSFSKSQY